MHSGGRPTLRARPDDRIVGRWSDSAGPVRSPLGLRTSRTSRPPRPLGKRWGLALFAASAFVAIFGLVILAISLREAWATSGPSGWALDLRLILEAGTRLAGNEPLYSDPRLLYPPLAAILGIPLAGLDPAVVALALAGIKIAIVALCVLAFSAGLELRHRVMALLIALCALPFLDDLLLGNVNTFVVAAMVPAVLGRPKARYGILLGCLAAAFAKPLLVPVLLWLFVWRPRVFAATIVSATACTLVAIALVGLDRYLAWLQVLAAGTKLASPFVGNHGVSALAPQLWAPVAVATIVGLVLILTLRGPVVGVTWAVTSGILIAPYVGAYGALPIALAIGPLAFAAPGLALAIVALSPLAATDLLPVYASGILVASLTIRERSVARFEQPGAVTMPLPSASSS